MGIIFVMENSFFFFKSSRQSVVNDLVYPFLSFPFLSAMICRILFRVCSTVLEY